MRIGALDDFDHPSTSIGGGLGPDGPVIAGISEDASEEGGGTAHLSRDIAHAVAILNAGGLHDNAQQEVKRINEDARFRVPLHSQSMKSACAVLFGGRTLGNAFHWQPVEGT
jgi:hypothetical protein